MNASVIFQHGMGRVWHDLDDRQEDPTMRHLHEIPLGNRLHGRHCLRTLRSTAALGGLINQHFARRALSLAVLALPLGLAACHKPHLGGQTVATVGGDDITRGDLQLELSSAPPAERKKLEPQALDALIDRKILTQYAKKERLDQSPDFILQLRRLSDLLLAQRAAQKIAADSRQPATRELINVYLEAHPDVASKRRLLLIDQLQFKVGDASMVADLKPARSLADVMTVLQRHDVHASHSQSQADTALLPDDTNNKLDQLQPGEPFIVINGQQAIASAIVTQQAAPLSGEAAAQVARRRIADENARAAIQRQRLAARQLATITYADGYGPNPATPPATRKP